MMDDQDEGRAIGRTGLRNEAEIENGVRVAL